MVKSELINYFYPNNYLDGSKLFYGLVKLYSTKNSIVLNLGAGPLSNFYVRSLKPFINKMIGADPDKNVLNNPDLDEIYIIQDNSLPFKDNFFDIVFCDYVLEHVEEPTILFSEIKRILKPNGKFLFRTPNKYHYVSIISNFTPHWFHQLIANKVRGLDSKNSYAPYKTYYKINSKSKIIKLYENTNFSSIELKMIEGGPAYLKFNFLLFLLGVAYERLLNKYEFLSFLRANIICTITK